jgi:hypothetical protein
VAARKSPAVTIANVVPQGDLRKSLEAIRDRLAEETDDTLWAKHKAYCDCQCGMGDGRLLVALTKRLSEVLAEIAALPAVGKVTKLDRQSDELASRRATRRAAGARLSGS